LIPPTVSEELSALPPESEEGPDELLVRQEQEAEFMALLDRLPMPQRSSVAAAFRRNGTKRLPKAIGFGKVSGSPSQSVR
jgi:hypothetical protein